MGSELARPPGTRPPGTRRPPPFCLCTTQRFVSVQHRNCLCATQKLSLFYREHIVSGQKLAKNQELAKIGRRATVLRFAGMGEHPTGLRKPLGLFLDPKNGQKNFFLPPWPPCWGEPLRAGYTGPPQQGDSNLGWVGGHQWGQSWRDRPPPAARPQASPLLFLCNTEICLCNTEIGSV